MPNRVLRDWTASEKMDQLTPGAEIFFVRLIMKVDDFGTFHANPKLLKAALYPLKEHLFKDVEAWLNEVAKAGLVTVYQAEEKTYLQIVDFNQRTRIKRSKFPQPSDVCQSNDGQMTGICRRETETETETETKPKTENKSSKQSLHDRKTAFIESLAPFANQYSENMLAKFANYWTEHNENGRKMLFEMKKTFNLEGRLRTWAQNDKDWARGLDKKQIETPTEEAEYLQRLKQRILNGGNE